RSCPRPTILPYTTLFRSLLLAQSTEDNQRWVVKKITNEDRRQYPIVVSSLGVQFQNFCITAARHCSCARLLTRASNWIALGEVRSEEHTSELQSRFDLLC